MKSFRNIFVAAVVAGLSTGAAVAEELAQPTGDVILTVTGNIANTNMDGAAAFDLEMLQAIDATSFMTATPWTDGQQEFTGVSLKALAETLGVTSGTIKATAINDYTIEIPLTDAVEGGPIVAYLHNGETMSVRDKGPLWVVYPYDLNPEYQTEVAYSRSIWQLDRMTVAE